MTRVEVRTDEGGDDLELAIAKTALKELLMLRIYADPAVGGDYAYSDDDVATARRNEDAAARRGLEAQVRLPDGRGTTTIRQWLQTVLDDLEPLARELGSWPLLEPLVRMATGGPNPAGEIRRWLARRWQVDADGTGGESPVPTDAIRELVGERWRTLAEELATAAERIDGPGIPAADRAKVAPLLDAFQSTCRDQPGLPIRLGDEPRGLRVESLPARAAEVVALASELVRIPSVTNCPDERVDEVRRCVRLVAGWLHDAGLEVRSYEDGKYPAVLAGFPGALEAPVTLCGHVDVVRPEPDDRQFQVRVEGDWLWGRGTADMKTVVASYLVWMAERARSGPPWPPLNLLVVGNEENGETEPWGTPHVLAERRRTTGWEPELMVVGERTGEEGTESFGAVCPSSRGVARLRLLARGETGHTGTGAVPLDLVDRLIEARQALARAFSRHLTLSAKDGWESGARFPFMVVGEPGVYNIAAGEGILGVEVRPIPEDDVDRLLREVSTTAAELGLELEVDVMEPGVTCPADDPHLERLLASVAAVSGAAARLGRKRPGSSARFAPGGRQVVWGQSGVGPHSKDERHWLPSIEPYLEVLDDFADRTLRARGGSRR